MYVTIREIAKKAGTSPASVSLALSGKSAGSRRLSSATVQKIRGLAREMGYSPNRLASSLRTKKTRTIGFLMRFLEGAFFADVLNGFNEVAYPAYDCLVAVHNDDTDKEGRHLEVFLSKRVDGIFCAFSGEPDSIAVYREVAEKYHTPVVLCDCGIPGLNLPVVRSDFVAGTYKATKALQGMGHKRIQYVYYSAKKQIDELREQGYRQAMSEAKLDEYISVIQSPHVKGWGEQNFKRIAKEVLDRWNCDEPKATALLISDDYLAYEILTQAEKKHHIAVPDGLSIMGIGDRFPSRLAQIGLSSIAGDHKQLGRKAATLLLSLIDGDSWDGREIVIPVSVKLRRTTGPVNGDRETIWP